MTQSRAGRMTSSHDERAGRSAGPVSPPAPWYEGHGVDREGSSPRAPTRIDLCGQLRARINDRDVAPLLPGPQGRALFAFLVLNRSRYVSREELIDALWPSDPPASPAAGLSSVLARVRRAVGRDVIVGRTQLSARLPPTAEVDVELIERSLQHAERALAADEVQAAAIAADAGLQIVERRLLPGLDHPWVEEKRSQLHEMDARLLEVRVRAALQMGGNDIVVAQRHARALTARHAFNERGYELLMEAQARRRNVAEALLTFERLRGVLRELGTVPSPSAVALHERLLLHGRWETADPADAQVAPLDAPPELPQGLRVGEDRRLVGRRRELDRLHAIWLAANTGRQQFAVVVGEPGIGKTRLAARFAETVHAQGAIVLYGRCDEETVVPYQPFVEAIRHYLQTNPASVDEYVGQGMQALGELVPEIHDLAARPSEVQYRDPDTQRYWLFEALTDLLWGWSRERSILLVLDDLHWAEKPTFLLLRHTLRHAATARVMILATARRTEDSIAELLAECEDRGTELPLAGLDDEATNAIVEARLEVPATAGFVRALHERTDGNPFFIEEALRSLTSSGALGDGRAASERLLEGMNVPERVQELTRRRLRRLSPSTVEAVTVAAVIARARGGFDLQTLEAVFEQPWQAVYHAIEEAEDSGLVVEGDAGRLVFSHALIGDAIYAALSGTLRVRLHQRVGEALEARSADAGELAFHFWTARELAGPERASVYSERAAAQAAEALAYEEAIVHYERALDAFASARPGDEQGRCELLLALGRVQRHAGEPAARDTYRAAAASAQRRGAADQLTRAALGLAERCWEADVDGVERGYLTTALQMLSDEDSVTRVHLLARLAEHQHFAGDQAEGLALSSEAVQMAGRLQAASAPGDAKALTEVLLARRSALKARHFALLDIEHLEERMRLMREIRSLADGHRELSGEVLQWWMFDLIERGDVRAARRVYAEFEEVAQELQQPLFDHVAAAWEGVFAQLSGDTPAAERLAADALASGRRAHSGDAWSTRNAQLFSLRRQQGRLTEMLSDLEELSGGPIAPVVWNAALAIAYVESGRPDDGRARYERYAKHNFDSVPRGLLWLPAAVLLAEVCAALGDRPRAHVLYEMLLPYAGRYVQVGLATCWGSVERYLGLLAATRGDTGLAERHYQRAVERNRAIDAPLLVAAAQCDYAVLLRRRGDPSHAAELGAAAEELAGARGSVALAARAAELRRGGGLSGQIGA
jgi:DNA-binding SARP family transcriptional activator/tetratricopeptide (TPR) repeat protein